MGKIKIHHSANSMSLQDMGFKGYQSWGISESGVIDRIAYAQNHALLEPDNNNAAVIEICHAGGVFESLDKSVGFALTGGVFDAHIDDQKISWGQSHILYPQQKLTIGKNINGQYGYIGFGGGVVCDTILGARATHINNGFGGYQGRFLKTDDILTINDDYAPFAHRKINFIQNEPAKTIRIIKHLQSDYFDEQQRYNLQNTDFNLSPRFSRRSAILTPKKNIFERLPSLSLLSEATVCGDLQVTGDGNLHLLLNERQPTGGYARIGTVITADIARCAQMDFRHNFRFKFISIAQAQKIYQQYMTRITNICDEIDVIKHDDIQHNLLSHNLISGVVNINDNN